MATTPTSVRVEEEKLEQFKEMQREIGSGAEFSNWALEMFKMHQSSKTSDQFAKDVEKIGGMMKAIAGMVNGIVAGAEGAILTKEESIKNELKAKDQEAEELKVEMELLREDLKKKDEEISNRNSLIKEVQRELKENKELLEKTQKEHLTTSKLNEMLMAEKERYQAIESNNEQLVIDNKALTEKLIEVEKQATESMQKITALETEKQAIEQRHAETITSLKDKHRQALDHADALKGVAVKDAKADAREEAQAKIEAHIEAENKLRKELDESRKEIYAINNNIKEMQGVYQKEMAELKAMHSKEVAELKSEIKDLKGDGEHKSSEAKTNK